MNAEREKDLMCKLANFESSYNTCVEIIKKRNETIKLLEQQIHDLEGQLRQWGIDKGAKKGLFLK